MIDEYTLDAINGKLYFEKASLRSISKELFKDKSPSYLHRFLRYHCSQGNMVEVKVVTSQFEWVKPTGRKPDNGRKRNKNHS